MARARWEGLSSLSGGCMCVWVGVSLFSGHCSSEERVTSTDDGHTSSSHGNQWGSRRGRRQGGLDDVSSCSIHHVEWVASGW